MQRFKIVNGFNGMECEDHDQNVYLFDTPEEAQAFIDEHHPWMGTGTLGDYTMIVPANAEWEHDHLGGAAFPNNAWQCGDFVFRVTQSPHGNDFAMWRVKHYGALVDSGLIADLGLKTLTLKLNGGASVDLDGTRMLTAEEYAVVDAHVKWWCGELEKMAAKKKSLAALHERVQAWDVDQDDLEQVDLLIESSQGQLLGESDALVSMIDEVWRLCPEAVTGGGYALHKARWESEN
jgi:hypothetical protein